MNSNHFTESQRLRFYKIRDLARRSGNLSLSAAESHLDPYYKNVSEDRLRSLQKNIFDAFMSALLDENIPVILWADDRIRSLVSFEGSYTESARGKVLRLLAKKTWFENNWWLFADNLGDGTRRYLFVFLKFNETTLSRMAAPWWDPNVLMNPSAHSSPSLLKQVRARLEPGIVVFSLGLDRLRSSEIFFHPADLDIVSECICKSAQKQEWWKD